jgi:cysteine desulfurase/selenocysteine lyase
LPLPHKFEAGTPKVADAVGLAATCECLDGIGMRAVRERELRLLGLGVARPSAIDGVRMFGPADLAQRSARAGHRCAQPSMRRLRAGVHATARASSYVYNDESDVEALGRGVERVIRCSGGRARLAPTARSREASNPRQIAARAEQRMHPDRKMKHIGW